MKQTEQRSPLLELSFEALVTSLGGPGRAALVMKALRDGRNPFEDDRVGRRTKDALKAACSFEPLALEHLEEASDGTLKAVLLLHDNARIETVLIPTAERTTVCISSQVGCSRQCQFCMTAEMGLMRQLSITEIIMQVWWARRIVREYDYPELRNIVFMGMGEPLDNWAAVEPAIKFLCDQQMHGFGARHVTLSTVGPSVEKIERLRDVSCKLAWSIHETDDAKRRALIPTQREPLSDLVKAFGKVVESRNDSLFLEYTLIKGRNDSIDDAQRLVELAQQFGVETRVNLLPVNPGRAEMHPPSHEVSKCFAQHLKDAGIITILRLPRGQDQSAACGQLIQRLKKKRADESSARFIILDEA